jgi:hypothetical protein
MSDALKHIYNACDPYMPATAEYYYNCAEARGGSALVQEFQRHLFLANDYIYFLFSGHIGCGKSSELEQLKRSLTDIHRINEAKALLEEWEQEALEQANVKT